MPLAELISIFLQRRQIMEIDSHHENLAEEVPLLNPTHTLRRNKIIGSVFAIQACFIFTWVAFMVQTFGENVSDIMFVRSLLQTVIFAFVMKYQKLDFWLCRNDFESRKKYWLHCGLLIFQVSYC